jgi:23S rRNA (uridine2552-2'-O)-methyltransferase
LPWDDELAIKDQIHLDDHYSRKARQDGYPARSVYKLEEMDRKHRLFRPGQHVLDLGCAPGSWSLYAAQKVGPGGLVLGLDLQPSNLKTGEPRPRLFFLRADLLTASPELAESRGPFDLVLSDLAPATCGRKEVDQARSLALVQAAWTWAEALLKSGGHFLYKIFQSPEGENFSRDLKEKFNKVELLKPKATRSRSREIFGLGLGFQPGSGQG